MNTRLILKMTAVAAGAAAGLVLALGRAPPSAAAASGVSASASTFPSGGSVTINVSAQDDVGNLAINASSGALTLTGCSGGDGSISLAGCQANASGNGTGAIALNTAALDPDTTI